MKPNGDDFAMKSNGDDFATWSRCSHTGVDVEKRARSRASDRLSSTDNGVLCDVNVQLAIRGVTLYRHLFFFGFFVCVMSPYNVKCFVSMRHVFALIE